MILNHLLSFVHSFCTGSTKRPLSASVGSSLWCPVSRLAHSSRSLRLLLMQKCPCSLCRCYLLRTATSFFLTQGEEPARGSEKCPHHFLLLAFLSLYAHSWSHKTSKRPTKAESGSSWIPTPTPGKYIIILSKVQRIISHQILKKRETLLL